MPPSNGETVAESMAGGFLVAVGAVFLDFIMHKLFFEPYYQDLIFSGYFRVEGLFYYGTKFLIILLVSTGLLYSYGLQRFFPFLNAFLSASAFSLFYYLFRPTGPFTGTYSIFLFAMYVTHFSAVALPSIIIWLRLR